MMTATTDRAELVTVFKTAWHKADREGRFGGRTEAGIDAVLAALAAPPSSTILTLAERIGEHVASEYEEDPALDDMILQLRAALAVPATPPEDLATAVFEALGAVSVCWSNYPSLGVFDSTEARRIGDELMAKITPLLGAIPATGETEPPPFCARCHLTHSTHECDSSEPCPVCGGNDTEEVTP